MAKEEPIEKPLVFETFELTDKRSMEAQTVPSPELSSVSTNISVKSWPSITVYITQVIIVYIVILCALLNLTFYPTVRQELWITLLSSSIGYLLPSPYIKRPVIAPNGQ
jgi:hypothetical protein